VKEFDAFMMIILRTAAIVGVITFLLGFVGPIIFSTSNLGPLLGIFITGPLGFLLGGVIGFWRLLSVSTRKISAAEWGLLLVIGLLSMGWYLMFSLFGHMAIVSVICCQLVAVVGTALVYHQRKEKLQQPFSNRLLLALFASLLIIGTEIFPPVTHPDWARPQDGYLQDPPAATYFWDSRMDASRKVPQLAIHRNRLAEFWFLVVAVNSVAWFVMKPNNFQGEDRSQR
jgi:hypothetical protein